MDNSATEITVENEGEIMSSIKNQLPCEERKGYLGQTLREFRKKTGKTQAEVAKECSMSTAQYNYYEKGQYFPDTDRLIQICDCINADPLAVFAVALDRSKKGISATLVPVSTYENVAKAFHKKIDQIAEEDKEMTLI